MPAPQPYQSLQGPSTPTPEFRGTFSGQLGWWFTLSQPARLVGYRLYQNAGDFMCAPFVIWNADLATRAACGLASASQCGKASVAVGWHNYFIRPNVHLPAGVELQFSVGFDGTGGVYSAFNAAIDDITSGIITLIGSLHEERGGVFAEGCMLLNSAPLNTGPNLYGVDIIVLPE